MRTNVIPGHNATKKKNGQKHLIKDTLFRKSAIIVSLYLKNLLYTLFLSSGDSSESIPAKKALYYEGS